MDTHIVVRGTAQARVMPDRAMLQLLIEGEAGSRENTYRKMSDLAKRVDAALDHRSAGLDRVTTAALVLQPKNHRHEGLRSAWRGIRSSTVEVIDLSVLGDLIAELTGAGGAVAGPAWHLDPGNPVHAEVRRLAALDARTRAGAYADALGLKVSGVAWVAEPGLRDAPVPELYGLPAPGGAVRARAIGAEEVIEVVAEEVTVEAQVDVGFAFGPAGALP